MFDEQLCFLIINSNKIDKLLIKYKLNIKHDI